MCETQLKKHIKCLLLFVLMCLSLNPSYKDRVDK